MYILIVSGKNCAFCNDESFKQQYSALILQDFMFSQRLVTIFE